MFENEEAHNNIIINAVRHLRLSLLIIQHDPRPPSPEIPPQRLSLNCVVNDWLFYFPFRWALSISLLFSFLHLLFISVMCIFFPRPRTIPRLVQTVFAFFFFSVSLCLCLSLQVYVAIKKRIKMQRMNHVCICTLPPLHSCSSHYFHPSVLLLLLAVDCTLSRWEKVLTLLHSVHSFLFF